ncbi:MAG: FAD:protein FMN transferase [Flavobacterium sp.]
MENSFAKNPQVKQPTVQKRFVKLMGSQFDITVVADTTALANDYIDLAIDEIIRIENLISEWNPATQLSAVNQNAGIQPVKVDQELFDLTARAVSFSKITDGAFDISFAAAAKIWKFDGSVTELPSEEAVKESTKNIGYQNIILDWENQTIFLKNTGMKIGFGSIGKGYAADMAKKLLISKGVFAGIINASGDMNSWGTQPDGMPWTIGITNPLNKEQTFAHFPLNDSAVATSGIYEKFLTIDGKRYSHIIDPRTGYPSTGISSVTVFAKSAELGNGLSTSMVVMGIEAGLDLINQVLGVSAVIIDDSGKIYYSDNIEINRK